MRSDLGFYLIDHRLIALVMLIVSLAISVREIQISVKALDLHISDMEI